MMTTLHRIFPIGLVVFLGCAQEAAQPSRQDASPAGAGGSNGGANE